MARSESGLFPGVYDTLSRLISGGIGMTPRPEPSRPRDTRSAAADGLLNLQRLESYRRLGMLEELVNDYVPEMARVVACLQEAVDDDDMQGSIDALHSLLGMSGEAGAQALHQQVRKLYVPLLEQGAWPAGADWLPQLKDLALHTEQALRALCAAPARTGAS